MMSFGSMVERGPHDKSLSGNRVCSREHAHRKKRNVHMITSEKKFIKFIVHVLAIDSENNLFQQLIFPVHQMHGGNAYTKWFNNKRCPCQNGSTIILAFQYKRLHHRNTLAGESK
jgi:hypothetical protein